MKQTAMRRALALALLLPACNRPDQKAETPSAPPEPNTVTYTAADYAYTGPDTIPAGVTTFRLVNNGKEPHHMFLVRLNEGKTVQDLLPLMQDETKWPAWAVMVGGPNAAEAGDTIAATVTVDSGNYVFFCVIPSTDGTPHIAKGMMHNLTVTPATGLAAAEPVADLTIKLVDYGFEVSAPITAGRHTIKVENPAAQPHEMVLVRLEPGKTIQDWLAAAEKMAGPLPGHLIDGIAGLAPGRSGYVTADFTPGEYGFVCFVSDAKDGKSHFLHGMVQQVTVS